MTLIPLPSNRPAHRFYRGGTRITSFRGEPPAGTHEPEDWVASTTTLAGETRLGLTTLPDGRVLAEAIAADPRFWLGTDHLEVFGDDTRLLVKLLDAGQRLPVHAHPDDAFAASAVHRPHGKTEAWYILEGGTVHLGLRSDVAPEELARLTAEQDGGALLELLHEREVAPGDTVLVPAGVLHAIGRGILLVELQQPEDLSILLEWRGFALDGATHGHLGLGFEAVLPVIEHRARTEAEIDALITRDAAGPSVLPAGAEPYFRLDRHAVGPGGTRIAPGFAVAVTVDGDLALTAESGDAVAAPRGATVLIAHAAGVVEAHGSGVLLVARPPHPDAGGPR